jgi:hypothetical protein
MAFRLASLCEPWKPTVSLFNAFGEVIAFIVTPTDAGWQDQDLKRLGLID